MKILKQDSTEGVLISAYQCDYCKVDTIDSELPPDWLEDFKGVHYCKACIDKLGD